MRISFHIVFKALLIKSLFLVSLSSCGQNYALFGHFHDLPGYYNPALYGGGKYTEIGVIHRSQWSNLGYPSINSFFFKYPPKLKLPFLEFRSVGLMVQYQDLSLVTQTLVQAFTSNTLVDTKKFDLNVGLSTELRSNGLNLSGLNLSELSDPSLIQIHKKMDLINRVGMSLETKKLEVGFASGIDTKGQFSDFTGTARTVISPSKSKLSFRPGLIYRISPTMNTQIEGQLRAVYDRRMAFTAGYRQDYGFIFQLGALIDKFKGSYGSEVPSGKKTNLGLTHEVFLSYRFVMQNNKKALQDSLLKKKRDSLNLVRLNNLRKARLDQTQQREDERKAAESKAEKDTLNTTTEDHLVISQNVVTFDEIPKHLKENNMHAILSHIGFETDYDILKPYAYKELDKLVDFLKRSDHFNIEIQGHTDNVGSAKSNYELSYRRALTVYNYLISRGIPENRMKVVGYGEDSPLYDNSSDEGRELNRRIEIVFINTLEK